MEPNELRAAMEAILFISTSFDAESPIRYRFSFLSSEEAKWPMVPFGSLIYSKKLAGEIAKDLVTEHGANISEEDLVKLTRNIERAKREFEVTEALLYQEIDGTDEDNQFVFEDIVEIFIRANSGARGSDFSASFESVRRS